MFWGVLKGFSEIQLILAVLDPPKVQKLPRFIQVLGLRDAANFLIVDLPHTLYAAAFSSAVCHLSANKPYAT